MIDPKHMRVSNFPMRLDDLYASTTADHPEYGPMEVLTEAFRQISLGYKEAVFVIAAMLMEQPGQKITITPHTLVTLPTNATIVRTDSLDGSMTFRLEMPR